MSRLILLSNGLAVGLFGGVLSIAFCGALGTPRKRWTAGVGLAGLLVLQGVVYTCWDGDLLAKVYPLVTHLPLVLLLCGLTGKRLWPVVSMLTAYLCCQLRRWLALVSVLFLRGGEVAQAAAELIVTLPLLLLLVCFVAPAVRAMERYPARIQWRFGLIPAIYYGFDYLTCVYTDLLARGVPAALEFMPFICCVAYLVFLLRTYMVDEERSQMEQAQNSLNLQVKQSLREIAALRESQKQISTYRHDLRHHLQYLSACLENGQEEQAREYIHGICAEIEAQKVRSYCENETANLIVSAFAGRAAKAGVALRVEAALPPFLSVSDSDLCVVLSNALENALNAAKGLAGERVIEVRAYEKGQNIFLQVVNPYKGPVVFKDGRPVTDRPGHGVGVRSICAIVERYGGVYSFSAQDGRFILRLSF